MSRLMDDLNKLSRTRKVDEEIIVKDAEEITKAPVANSPKTAYFIGFLIMLLVGLSAASLALSLKTLWRSGEMERSMAAANRESGQRLKDFEGVSQSLRDVLKTQQNDIKALNARIEQQGSETVENMNEIKRQVDRIKGVIRMSNEELERMEKAQGTFKGQFDDAIGKLKTENKRLNDQLTVLEGKVSKLIEMNAYLYNTY